MYVIMDPIDMTDKFLATYEAEKLSCEDVSTSTVTQSSRNTNGFWDPIRDV